MLLETRHLHKAFGGNYALNDVDFSLEAGEVHGLVGENGAGKSTLIKILTGVYQKTAGDILWEGRPVEINDPVKSRQIGINVIHQDRNLIPSFNCIENIYLGLPYPQKNGCVDWDAMKRRALALMDELGIELPLSMPASELTPPQKTLVEIVRAMLTSCRLLILDEPTASLTDKETELLFAIIERLRQKGASVLYVTHRLEEIVRITDRVTVFKNGACVGTVKTSESSRESIISLMTDSFSSRVSGKRNEFGRTLLKAEHIATRDGIVKDASFEAREGEILGIFGLSGAGRTELLECVYGYRPAAAGNVQVDGRTLTRRSSANSIQNGMVLIHEDRRGKAIVPGLSVSKNIVLSTLKRLTRLGFTDESKEKRVCAEQIEALSIKLSSPAQPVAELSGGNQQKVVFAKAILCEPKVYLCDEPTQAVDVKTRSEIHAMLRQKAAQGSTVVFVTSDLKEMLEVADCIQILSGGRTWEFFVNDGLTAEQILSCCYAQR